MWTKNFQAGFKEAEELEIKLPTSVGLSKKRVPEKHLLLLHWLRQTFDCMDHNKLWEKRWEYQTTLPVSWETYMWVKKQQLEQTME